MKKLIIKDFSPRSYSKNEVKTKLDKSLYPVTMNLNHRVTKVCSVKPTWNLRKGVWSRRWVTMFIITMSLPISCCWVQATKEQLIILTVITSTCSFVPEETRHLSASITYQLQTPTCSPHSHLMVYLFICWWFLFCLFCFLRQTHIW